MKVTNSLVLLAVFLFSAAAFAAYDNTWYQAEYWSGEYPNGISVIKKGVALPARSAMDRDLNVTIKCEVPFKAVYSPWNQARPARYFSAVKIVPMTANEPVTLTDDMEGKVEIPKGGVIEYLIYGAEGYFTVRYDGREFTADQDLFEKVTFDKALMETPQDEWLNLTCVDGTNAWVYLPDLSSADRDGNTQYLEGLDSWYRGFREYGVVTDLTDEDLKEQKP